MHSKLFKKKISFIGKALFSILLITTFFAPLQGLLVSQAKAQSVVNARATSDANNPNISPTASGATASGQGGTAGPSGAGQTAVECSWSPSNWGICFTNVVYVFTVGLMSIFAYIGAFIFDTAVQITLQSVTYSQYFLTESWAAVRDLANMIFIFLLVYLAVTVILQAETQGTMKMLAGIIIAALLINFSFFFTRLVIDGGNILATQFYNAIPAPTLNSSGATGTGTMGAVQAAASSFSSNGNVKDLTRGIMDVVGVQSILGSGSFARFSQQGANEFTKIITLVFVYIAVAMILAMLAFTFIAVGVKFLVRIVVLWLAIIASPLAFVFGAMYKKGSADRFNVLSRWGKALIEYAFYPAVFLFIFWVINFFATQLASNGTSSILANALNDAGSAATNGQLFTIASAVAGVSVRLGIIVALIYMAMRVSDSFAKTGFKAADTFIGKASGWTTKKLTGVARLPVTATKLAGQGVGGYAYRNAIASPIKKYGDKFSKSKMVNQSPTLDRFADRVVQKRFVKPVTEAKPFGITSFADAKKYKDDRSKEMKKNLDTLQNKEDIKKLPELQAEIKPLVAREKDEKQLKTVIDRLNKIDAIEKSINTRQQELSDKIMIKKEALSPSEKAEFDNFDNQRALANEEKNALSKEKNDLEARKNPLTDEEKDSLREKRASIQKIEERIKDFNKPQLEAAFTAKDVQNIIGSIKESTLKKLEDSDKFSDQDKEAIREKWQKESSDSALQKAQKQIDLLKQIHQDLKQQSSFRVSLQSIENHLKSGQLLSSSAVQDMLSEVNSKLVEERERRSARDLDRESKIIAGKNITELDKINKALQKLDDERAKVPPKIANGNNAGEFKIV